MRVIAGTARHLQLETPRGKHTRPTSDKIKETLFNILQQRLEGSVFLDLYAGSGGIGIEALSRGAGQAVLVDNDREALRCIRSNLAHTGLEEAARVMAMDALHAVRRLEAEGAAFDIIFMDPPYQAGQEAKVLPYLLRSEAVQEDTLVILEAAKENDLSFLEGLPCIVERIKEYKTNRHIFMRKKLQK